MKFVLIALALILGLNLLFFVLRALLPPFEAVQWVMAAVSLVLGFSMVQSQGVRGEMFSRSRGNVLDERTARRLQREKKAQENWGLVMGTLGLSLVLSGLLL